MVHDWTGSRVRADALTVPCRYCHALVGELCVNDGQPLSAFPAHDVRVRAAEKKQETP